MLQSGCEELKKSSDDDDRTNKIDFQNFNRLKGSLHNDVTLEGESHENVTKCNMGELS